MVRNDQFPPIGKFAQAIASAVNDVMATSGISGNQLAKKIGRVQSYVSVRARGLKAWDLDEVDQIAHITGTTFDDIIKIAREKYM